MEFEVVSSISQLFLPVMTMRTSSNSKTQLGRAFSLLHPDSTENFYRVIQKHTQNCREKNLTFI